MTNIITALIIVALVALLIVGVWFAPYQEAKSFNKFNTHAEKATTWDALFTELRIEACN